MRAADGRGPETRLQALVFEALEVDVGRASSSRACTRRGCPSTASPPWRGLVADGPRPRATRWRAALIDGAGHELALAARAVARQLELGDEPFPVVLAGGVFKACPSLVDPLDPAAGPARRPAERCSPWSRRAAPWPWPSTS